MVHRYVEPKEANGFKGEVIVLSDGDWDNLDEKTYSRLKKAKDYLMVNFVDDVSIIRKKELKEEYKEYKKYTLQDGEDIQNFKEWLMDKEFLLIVIKE